MEKSNKRGKIPQSDWPSIMARYEAGETLASIAKTYDCSPPAISYIVSRSRARAATHPAAPVMTEPQLIKTHPHPVPVTESAAPAAVASAGDSPQLRHGDSTAHEQGPAGLRDRSPEPQHAANGF